MSDQRFIIEMGMGNDQYGQDYTQAAARAIEDALRHSAIPLFEATGISHDAMRVQVTPGAQDPVFAFNAGIVNARGLYDELADLAQPLLLLEGESDWRKNSRNGYIEYVPDCTRATIGRSLNIAPYEAPSQTAAAVLRHAAGVGPAMFTSFS